MTDTDASEMVRRAKAALEACEGLPTDWLERGLIKALYSQMAFLALADHLGDRKDGNIYFPEPWWARHVRDQIDILNNIAKPERIQ